MESVSRLDTNQVITVMTDNVAEEAKKGKSGFFSRIKAGLSKTQNKFSEGMGRVFLGEKIIDESSNSIPMPPPLPIPCGIIYNPIRSKSFEDELALVRNKVMGRKNDNIVKPRKNRWFSFFR